MTKLLEKYYNRPILYDYVVSLLSIGVLYILKKQEIISIPSGKFNFDFASDIGAIGLTVSGFILTLITILISFKSAQLSEEEKLKNNSNPFKIFLASNLYKSSVKILQKGVVSLIVISFLIFLSKLILINQSPDFIFYLNITGLIIILSTFLRCYYVLGLILKMQK
jgi:membrane-associated HD superfamily phosphohydrolase